MSRVGRGARSRGAVAAAVVIAAAWFGRAALDRGAAHDDVAPSPGLPDVEVAASRLAEASLEVRIPEPPAPGPPAWTPTGAPASFQPLRDLVRAALRAEYAHRARTGSFTYRPADAGLTPREGFEMRVSASREAALVMVVGSGSLTGVGCEGWAFDATDGERGALPASLNDEVPGRIVCGRAGKWRVVP